MLFDLASIELYNKLICSTSSRSFQFIILSESSTLNVKVLASGAAIGIGVIITLGIFVVARLQPASMKFNSETWKTCTDHSLRYRMSTDFLQTHKVVGMTKEQLEELLGHSDGESNEKISWDLGQYLGADDSAIDFKLKDGKVTDVDVWGH
jgi:hypothetical protein